MQRRKMVKSILTLFSIILLLGISSLYVAQGLRGEDAVTKSSSRSLYQGQPQTVPQLTNLPQQNFNPQRDSLRSMALGTSLETAEGDIQWFRTYGGSEYDVANVVIQTMDGGFALAGLTQSFGAGEYDAWLVKTDARGTMEWNRTYGGAGNEEAYAMIQTADGGFALAGRTLSFGPGKFFNAWLVKTDADGNMEWDQTYGGFSSDSQRGDEARTVLQTADGGFALVGVKYSYSNQSDLSQFHQIINGNSMDVWLMKTDPNGEPKWRRTFGGSGYDEIYSIIETSDDGYVLAGSTASYGEGKGDVWLVKTNTLGKVMWMQTYGGDEPDGAYAIIKTIDGGYALAGYSWSYGSGPKAFWLVKTDAHGNMKWDQTYGGAKREEAWAVIQRADGGFALAGWTESFGAGSANAWLVKTDVWGEEEWTQTYGGSFHDIVKSIIRTTDGEFALAGGTRSFGVGGYDFWLVKTGPKLDTTPPALSSHTNITYEEGMTDHVIAWMVGDRHPGTYELCTNSQLVDSGTWTNGTITWNVDSLAPGTYNVTLIVWDATRNSISGTVWVTVFAAAAPELSAPEDIAYAEGTTVHVITWVVADRHPGTYVISTNSRQVDSGSWTNGTILWHVDGLNPGVYNITLSVQDAAGNSVSDTVWVTVTVSEPLPLPELPIIRILILLSLVALVTLRKRKKPWH